MTGRRTHPAPLAHPRATAARPAQAATHADPHSPCLVVGGTDSPAPSGRLGTLSDRLPGAGSGPAPLAAYWQACRERDALRRTTRLMRIALLAAAPRWLWPAWAAAGLLALALTGGRP